MKKLIVATQLKPLMLHAMDFLRRDEIAVFPAPTHDDMLKIHIQENVNVMITKPDLPGMACETLVHTIRRAEHMRNVSIIILAQDTPALRERSTRCGVNAVLHLPVDPAIFAGKVLEFLAVAPRRHYRVVLNIAVDGKHNDRPFLCNMENISASGMLIRTPERLALGDRIACSFFLPTGKRVGTAGEVVRIVTPASAGDVCRYGVRFLSLAADAEASIAAFVDKDQQQRQAPAPGQHAPSPA